MNKLKRIHFWVGFIGVIIFLLTGQYMHHAYNHLEGMPNDTRMLFRSAHIYFLLSSIANLVAGVYLNQFQNNKQKILQYISSIILLISPLFLLAGFFIEPHLTDLARPFSRIGLYALFVSSVIYTYLGFKYDKM